MSDSAFPRHPGTIRLIDESDDSVVIVSADTKPERHQFVYFNSDGVEVDGPPEAVKRTPIVEVRTRPMDETGRIVPKDQAARIRVHEIGPEQKLLRWTLLVC